MIINKKASHDYVILDKFEAGIQLSGGEVKSLRKQSGSLTDSFVRIKDFSALLVNAYISPYQHEKNDPKRERKLLLHRKEIDFLRGKLSAAGRLSIIPLRLYFKGPLVKVEIALARGKKEFEKRETLKKRAIERDIEETLREDKLKA